DIYEKTLNRHRQFASGDLSLVLCDDEAIQAANFCYRGVDSPTDVIAIQHVCQDDNDESFAEEDHFSGDLVISIETAQRQAAQMRHSVRDEVRILAVHGMLHLFGYDHENDEAEEQEMKLE